MVVKGDIQIYGRKLIISVLYFTIIFAFVSKVSQSQVHYKIALRYSYAFMPEANTSPPLPLHETHIYPPAVRGNPQYRMLSKSEDTCRKYGQNWIYPPKYSMAFTVPIFTKAVFAERQQVQMFPTEFHLKRPIHMGIIGMNSFTPLSKARMSRRRISRNSRLLEDFL
jgi:hypothetical protein